MIQHGLPAPSSHTRSDENEVGDHLRHLLEVPVVVEKREVVFDRDTGDEAIHGGADGYPRATTLEVHARGFPVALDGVSRMVERLGAQISGGPVELLSRGDPLNDFLVDQARKPDRVAVIQYLRQTFRRPGLPARQVIDPDRSVYQVQGYFPSRSFL